MEARPVGHSIIQTSGIWDLMWLLVNIKQALIAVDASIVINIRP